MSCDVGRTLSLCCATLFVLACDRRDAPPAGSVPESVRTPEPGASGPNWVTELGPTLIAQLDSENTGVVLFPIAPSPRTITSSPLTLLNAGGDSASTRAALVVSDSQVCGEAPTIRLADPPSHSWSVAVLRGSAKVVPTDSIEGLPPADSARIVAELARLASALPMHKESRFAGLPFVVLDARRFEANGRQVIGAHLLRRLPYEASPFEEHTLLVAERPANGRSESFSVGYYQRSEGTEETSDHFEILSALRTSETTFLIIARDQEARTTYEILQRSSTGWRSRWQRTLAC